MNKTNPIFESLNELNENYAAEAVTKSRVKMKKPLKIALIAAAAVVTTLIVGSSMPRTKSYGKSPIWYGPGKDDVVVLYPTPQKFSYPDHFVFEEWDSVCSGELETLDDVRETFGITPIVNDNFTVGDSYGRHIYYNAFDTGLVRDLQLDYFLYDKNLGCNITLTSTHYSGVNFIETGNGGNSYNNVEILTLKDGSQCVIIETFAYFVSEGVEYHISVPSVGESRGYDEINNDLKQVLADLGVL